VRNSEDWGWCEGGEQAGFFSSASQAEMEYNCRRQI
jgi:hypothetical protein